MPILRLQQSPDRSNDGDNHYNVGVTFDGRTAESRFTFAVPDQQKNGWTGAAINTMQGLRILYDHTHRPVEWARLVDEISPRFVDPASGSPVAGNDDQWSMIVEYRMRIAIDQGDISSAERYQRHHLNWIRQRSASALAAPRESLDDAGRNRIRTLCLSIERLGWIQSAKGDGECLRSLAEALTLCRRNRDRPTTAVVVSHIGNAYREVHSIRNYDKAEKWLHRSVGLCPAGVHMGRAAALADIGFLSLVRFREAAAAGSDPVDLHAHLITAAQYYTEALGATPTDAGHRVATILNQMGVIMSELGNILIGDTWQDEAIAHFNNSIRILEALSDRVRAAGVRFNAAGAMLRANRLADAWQYAAASTQDFDSCNSPQDVAKAGKLLVQIEAAMKATGSAPPGNPPPP